MHTFLKFHSPIPSSPHARILGRPLAAFFLAGLGAVAALPAQAGPTIKSIASFIGNGSVGSYTNGTEPRNGVILDNSGNIFGTAYYGGDSNRGTVYEVVKGTNTVKALTSFGGGSPGAYPSGNIVMDGGGNIYGTTETGGSANSGTIYKLASGTSTVTTLATFDRGKYGASAGGLVSDGSGNLYGGIHYGGPSDYSAVYELLNGSSAVTTLATFNPSFSSISALTLDGGGNIFGTTLFGGAFNNGNSYGNGSIFEIAKGSGTVTILASFNGTNGYGPVGGITLDGDGNMFGTTQLGGAFNKGTIFEFAKGGTAITALASFTADTNNTQAPVTLDSAGNIFGTTPYGGPSGSGTVYELVKGSSTITTLASFDGANGGGPFTKVTLDGSGNLYGTTIRGGMYGGGTVFGIPGVGAPVPEASSVISLGLLLGLGGVCLAVRKRTKPAA